MLEILRTEGYQLSITGLRRIRRQLGLYRKLSGKDSEDRDSEMRRIVQQQLDEGVIQGYGRGYLHTHFRSQGHIVSRDRLFAIVKELYPEGPAARLKDMQRHRGEYIVPGPHYLWSLDGYCKLDPYGIEIYAAIDAYSRYIVWIYVGVSARTSNYLHQLAKDGLYDHSHIADRIALKAVLMPTLRREIFNFVRLWNVHKIRKQPNRPNVVVGQPWKLYNYPPASVTQCGIPVNMEYLATLQQDVRDWDCDAYLPDATLKWCEGYLKQNNFQSPFEISGGAMECRTIGTTYTNLKEAVKTHMRLAEEPRLLECERPLGGYNWQPAEPVVRLDEAHGPNVELNNEGPDMMLVPEDLEETTYIEGKVPP
ncbi:MAG: hypothetical protein M1823_006084, partial [Watsoniomyces obsoletus]